MKTNIQFAAVLHELTLASRYKNYKAAMFALDECKLRIAALPEKGYKVACAYRLACISRVTNRACSEIVKLCKLGAIPTEEATGRLSAVKTWTKDELSREAVDRAIHEVQCYRLAFGQLEQVNENDYTQLIRET